MRIAHFIPAYRRSVRIDAAYSAIRDAVWAIDGGHELIPFFADIQPIDRSRNWAVDVAISAECSHLFMQDADVWGVSVSPLQRLYTTMARTSAAVVGAMVMARTRQTMNCEPALPGEVFDGEVGTGLMLIDLRAIKVARPWFSYRKSADGVGVECGEDIGFCRAVKAAGLRVVVDGTVPTGHADEETLLFQPPVAVNRAGDDARKVELTASGAPAYARG